MKKTLLSAICLMMIAPVMYAASWPVHQVTKTVSLSFPSEPQMSAAGAVVNHVYITDGVSYLAQVKPYKNDGGVYDSTKLDQFYESMNKGIIKAAHGTVLRTEKVSVGGLKATEIVYVRRDENYQPVTVCARSLLLNGEVLIYSFAAPTAKYGALKSSKEKFLSSATFNKDSTLVQYQSKADTIVKEVNPPVQTMVAHTDSTVSASSVQPVFLDSHVGSVIKVFGLLILFSAIVYVLAVWSRRKG